MNFQVLKNPFEKSELIFGLYPANRNNRKLPTANVSWFSRLAFIVLFLYSDNFIYAKYFTKTPYDM